MRSTIFISLLLLFSGFANSTPMRGQSQISDPSSIITQAYDLNSNLIFFSTTEKVLMRSGDAVAITLAHTIGRKNIKDAQIERVCILLELAFKDPQLITDASNSNPDVSLLLLQSNKMHTDDVVLERRISALRNYLIRVYKNAAE